MGSRILRRVLAGEAVASTPAASNEDGDGTSRQNQLALARERRWASRSSGLIADHGRLSVGLGLIAYLIAPSQTYKLLIDCLHRRPSQRPKTFTVVKSVRSLIASSKTPPMWTPICIEAVMLKLSPRRAKNNQLALSCLIHHGIKLYWRAFLAWILTQLRSGSLHGLMLISYVIADETPTKCRVRPRVSAAPPQKRNRNLGDNKPKKSTAKVLQIEYHIALLVRGSITQDSIVMIQGELPCPLMSLDHVTAQSLAEAIERATFVEGLKELAPFFDLFVRAATLDGAGYNRKYKRAFDKLFPEASKWEGECDIHTWNNVLGGSLRILDADVSGSSSKQT